MRMTEVNNFKRWVRITVVTLVVYAVLVATHLGEFWPFSVYPMFSKAGQPWKRAIVQVVSDSAATDLWKETDIHGLAGQTLPLDDYNVNTNDIANYLSKTENWTPDKINGVRSLFETELKSKNLLIYQARGKLIHKDSIIVRFIPFFYFTPDTTIINSQLKNTR